MTASPERWPSASIPENHCSAEEQATGLKVFGFTKMVVEKEKEEKHFVHPTEEKWQFTDLFAVIEILKWTPEITEGEVSERVSTLFKGTPATSENILAPLLLPAHVPLFRGGWDLTQKRSDSQASPQKRLPKLLLPNKIYVSTFDFPEISRKA